AILFELVAGRAAFVASSLVELCAIVLRDPPARLSDLAPHAPAGLEAAVLRCLEKDPEQRFENLAELAQAITDFGTPGARASADRIARVLSGAPSLRGGAPVSAEVPAMERGATAEGEEKRRSG